MARKPGIKSLDEKILKIEQKIVKLQTRLEEVTSELDSLLQKKRELQTRTILEAIEKSGKSMDEVLRLIKL